VPREKTKDHPIGVLKKRSAFLAVAAARCKWVTSSFIVQQGERPPDATEIAVGYGLTASKKMIGNAVMRNRARRRLRALVREVFPSHAQSGKNYVLIARSGILSNDYVVLRQELEKALSKLKKKEAG
jgi:ribonuclease P protein component